MLLLGNYALGIKQRHIMTIQESSNKQSQLSQCREYNHDKQNDTYTTFSSL
jgi:hypothetical protein